ncbi:MAG: sulfotransferase [Actinobacteria bacterium]|jgi:hypothetical protein|nr:sulfotransferase [Actinomycetota bacterium]MDA8186293.1 sulfotransferase [Actinomycetota bacterium]
MSADAVASPPGEEVAAETPTGEGSPPMFVLTCPRSGSTLVRFLLDTHPDIVCPPELNLSDLCWQIFSCWQAFGPASGEAELRRSRAREQAREAIEALMMFHVDRAGKRCWCDKSLTSADRAGLLAEVFPEARFVCLYRHPMDVVYSGIEASPWGFGAFGYAPYVARNPTNLVAALLESWADHVEQIMGFEQRSDVATFRLYYEVLVAEPRDTLCQLFQFLGLSFDEAVISEAFVARHAPGPADRKILFEHKVHTGSVGRGSRVPADLVPPPLRERIKRLCEALGYPSVGEDWNRVPSPLRAALPRALEEPVNTRRVQRLLRRALTDRVAGSLSIQSDQVKAAFRVVVESANGPLSWLVEPEKRRVTRAGTKEETVVVMSENALERLASGELHPAVALDRGEVRIATADAGEEELTQVRRFFQLIGHERSGDDPPSPGFP